jgi:hypothetical protein
MEISKDSWHYKLIKEWDRDLAWDLNYRPTSVSFCKYFWCVLWCFPKVLAVLLVLAFLAACVFFGFMLFVVYPLNFFLIGLFDIVLLEDTGGRGIFSLAVVLLAITLIGIIETWKGDMKVRPSYLKRTSVPLEKDKEKKPSLLWEYIKAKKAKMCPLVTLKD